MGAWLTVGHPAALGAIERMLRAGLPHALLLSGPPSVGKRTLAIDLAAAVLCTVGASDAPPCRTCRDCRLIASGNHPDLHLLGPEGPGGQVIIGDLERRPEVRGVRHLIRELQLLPVESDSRVAVIDAAHRANEDAQNALLKLLEEPPPATLIVLCADDEERLLPTVRSRCARLRLWPAPRRDIEALLADRDLSDPPQAARLARMAGGRPGLAVVLAQAPDVARSRDSIARALLDLTLASRRDRLRSVRELVAQSADTVIELERISQHGPSGGAEPAAARRPPAERRAAAAALLDTWRAVARDLAVLGAGGRDLIRDVGLLEELERTAGGIEPGSAARFLGRLTEADQYLEENANPELLLDVLALAWPRARKAA